MGNPCWGITYRSHDIKLCERILRERFPFGLASNASTDFCRIALSLSAALVAHSLKSHRSCSIASTLGNDFVLHSIQIFDAVFVAKFSFCQIKIYHLDVFTGGLNKIEALAEKKGVFELEKASLLISGSDEEEMPVTLIR